MLAHRIALLAQRMGLPYPRSSGGTRLGLLGTMRVRGEIALIVSANVEQRLVQQSGLTPDNLVEELNGTETWAWAEGRAAGRWCWPERGRDIAAVERCSAGDVPREDFSVVFATTARAVRCVPSRDGSALMVLGTMPTRRAPCARLLLARFAIDRHASFDVDGFCTMLASHSRVAAQTDAQMLARDEAEERDFITNARRYLEALSSYEIANTPRAPYEIASRAPLRIRAAAAPWPRAFTRPGTLVQLQSPDDKRPPTFAVVDVSDDGEVLSLDADADDDLFSEGEANVRPNDAPFRRMREALDAIAMGAEEAHRRLLAVLTKPESVPALPGSSLSSDSDEADRQEQAVSLALATPDVALIHGPPGTGKTTVICRIVEESIRRGDRVLLVAPTHVALDNVLERVGDSAGVTAIRLGTPENVEEHVHRFLIQNRCSDLARRLGSEVKAAISGAPADDPVVAVQNAWAERVRDDEEVGLLLLLTANLVCATPIGIAMAREFRQVDAAFDLMIVDEASKATITDFLVPAARARRWILVGDHRQLPPYVDADELEAVVSERIAALDRAIEAGELVRDTTARPSADWPRELTMRLRRHFDNRMHPDPERVARCWREFVTTLAQPFALGEPALQALAAMEPRAAVWRSAQRSTSSRTPRGGNVDSPRLPHTMLRLGAELLELQSLALPSVFEHLTRLPASRSVRLNRQHRMHPTLASFSAELVYERDFPSAPETNELGLEIPTLEAPAIWVDTAFAPSAVRYERPRDQDWRGGDYFNDLEARVARELVEVCARWATQSWRGDLRARGRGLDASFEIGVICFYLRQASRVRDALFPQLQAGTDPWRRRWRSPAANGAPIEVHVSIVDRFQGREKDIVVLCTTRSNPDGVRGHVDNLNRLNVAVTRARHKRIVIGDSTTLAGEKPGRRRRPDDLLRRLYEMSEVKKRWGRELGGGR